MARMRDPAFYATTAQVLPTLLIAFAVELGFYVRRFTQLYETTRQETLDATISYVTEHAAELVTSPTSYGGGIAFLLLRKTLRMQGYTILGAIFAATILSGEVLSVLVMLLGTKGGLAPVAGPLCAASMIAGTLLILLLPLYRTLAQHKFDAVNRPKET
jgi:hypothetical protein